MAESQEEREHLLAAIRRLPEERQQLVILKFVDKLSNAEVGAIMDRSEGAIKSLYHRTLIALREDLTALQSDHPSESGSPAGNAASLKYANHALLERNAFRNERITRNWVR